MRLIIFCVLLIKLSKAFFLINLFILVIFSFFSTCEKVLTSGKNAIIEGIKAGKNYNKEIKCHE